MTTSLITPHQSQFYAWQLTRRAASDSVEALASTLVNSQVDLNPHQVEAALFACQNPLSRGVILADEVGLGKTIEAGLVISQRWAERRRKVLIIVPANLRKQWHQELQDKFSLQASILEAKSFNALRKGGQTKPFVCPSGPVICSYQFAKSKAKDIKAVEWDLVVMDEAHRLRNVHKKNNVIGKTLKDALFKVQSKVLLTATPLQNSLLELYGLVSMIDDRVFGDADSFRAQFATPTKGQTFEALRNRLAPLCKRTLRRQVQPYVSYTARRAIVQEFTPTDQEREFSNLVASSYEVKVSRGFTELRPCNYTAAAGQPVQLIRDTLAEVSKIRQMLFGGFAKCLYPLQKFDSDTERRFAVILERDAIKWFKPAKGQFQIFYKLGTEQPEYIPDFVVETDQYILMAETKAKDDMNDGEVKAKADAAIQWCKHASDYAQSVGGKPWKYLLVPHDGVSEAKRLVDYLQYQL